MPRRLSLAYVTNTQASSGSTQPTLFGDHLTGDCRVPVICSHAPCQIVMPHAQSMLQTTRYKDSRSRFGSALPDAQAHQCKVTGMNTSSI